MVLKDFTENYTLLDAELISLEIFQSEGILKIIQVFNLVNGKQAKFTFEGIIAYDFSYHHTYDFYIVSDYLLVDLDDAVYLSLDPFNPELGVHEQDMDYIESHNLHIEII